MTISAGYLVQQNTSESKQEANTKSSAAPELVLDEWVPVAHDSDVTSRGTKSLSALLIHLLLVSDENVYISPVAHIHILF